MIKVVAKCIVKAEEIQRFKQYTSERIEQTRKEAGNISYAHKTLL
jgi:quinol monooxygenase YgiN